MLHRCLYEYGQTHDIQVLFANTGCEAEETLRFVDAVDRNFCQPLGFKVVWIEGEFHPKGKGPTAKVVTYETADRTGKPFEAAIRKHGIFSKTHPNCTGRLKVEPMESYLREQVGWKTGTWKTAIGIRSDEIDRVSVAALAKGYIYPLADEGWRKESVKKYMSQFDWDLNLPGEHYGNCVWCWKKSNRKLMTLAKDDPAIFDFPAKMERLYGHIDTSKDQIQEQDRTFFRGRMSALQLIDKANSEKFEAYTDQVLRTGDLFSEWLDVGSGCGESCEIGAD
jgi:hypothetical protein